MKQLLIPSCVLAILAMTGASQATPRGATGGAIAGAAGGAVVAGPVGAVVGGVGGAIVGNRVSNHDRHARRYARHHHRGPQAHR